MIFSPGIDPGTAKVLDAGGGASVLVDDLVDIGFCDIAVVDISRADLQVARERFGPDRSHLVTQIESDITEFRAPETTRYQIWHDRAVFHFLTSPQDRARYIEVVKSSLAPGENVVIATFGLEEPSLCSGLGVVRYSPGSLLAEFGPGWRLQASRSVSHQTPWHAEQKFSYCILTKSIDTI